MKKEEDGAESVTSSCVSMKSDQSKDYPPTFRDEPGRSDTERIEEDFVWIEEVHRRIEEDFVIYTLQREEERPREYFIRRIEEDLRQCDKTELRSLIEEKCRLLEEEERRRAQGMDRLRRLKLSDSEMDAIGYIKEFGLWDMVPSGLSARLHQTNLDSVFTLLEKNIVTFVKNGLKKFKKILSPDYPEGLESQSEKVLDCEEEGQRSSRDALLNITLDFLRRMNQKELADCLQSRSPPESQHKVKSNMKNKFQSLFEGSLLNQFYTKLIT